MNTTFSSSPLQQTLMLPTEQGVSIQRFDNPKYRQFLKLYEAQLQSFWMPDEIDMKTDRTNMPELTEAEEHVVMSNIKRQILLDSIMGRAPISVFGPAISDPTLEACVQAWTNMECLHSDTEVLTPYGWISISEITTEDLVCQFDLKNGSFSFVNPSAVTFKKTDKAISFFNGIFEQFVTHNHRMCVVNGDYSGGFIEARSFINGDVDVLGFINAGRLENSNVSAPSDTDLYTIMLSELNGEYNEEEDIYEVLIERDSKHNTKFLDIMNKMGLYFDTFEESPSSCFIKYQITEASRCIGANNLKNDLSSILLSTPYNYLDSHYCKFILDEMLFWSGSVHNLNGTDYCSYSSDNKNKIDFVQTVASLAGAKTRVSKNYCSSNNNTKLVVYIYDGLPYEELSSLNIAEIELNEPTVFYCLTVPTSAFLIRYNNKISVTGNCLHSYSYTHIIQQSFVNPTKTLDEVMSIEQIVKCKDSVVKYYDKCIDSVDKYYRGEIPRIDAIRDVWLALNTANALESVRFQLSFACSFIFGQTGKLPGLARIVKLIQRDECVVPETEVLTPKGWKRIDSITPEDKVAQYNLRDGAISFVIPERIVKSNTNEIHHYSGSGFAQSVTPNHRMLASRRISGEIQSPGFVQSKEFKNYKESYTYVSGHHIYGEDELTPLEKLFVAIQADGHISKRCSGTPSGYKTVVFCFSKQKKIDRLIKVFEDCGFEWVESAPVKTIWNKKAKREFIVYLPEEIIDGINLKSFSSWVNLEEKSSVWCKRFVKELSYWNCHTPKDESCKYIVYTSKNKENCDIVQAIAHLSGNRAKISVRDDREQEASDNSYMVYIFDNVHMVSMEVSKRQIECLNKDVDMYCVTVPNGAFVTRLNDKVSITGNCLHVAITNNLLKVLPQDDLDFAMVKEEESVKRAVEEIWRDAILEEDEWAKYLFSKGEIFAFNYRILNQYLRYIVTSRLEKNELPKLEELCDMKSEYVNPIPWILKWTGEEKDQTAPQEAELTNYERATFDISNGSFDNIEM